MPFFLARDFLYPFFYLPLTLLLIGGQVFTKDNSYLLKYQNSCCKISKVMDAN